MSKLHGFLHRYYRIAERHRGPRCVSMEVERGGTFDGALRAEEWRIWALLVMGRAEVDPRWTDEHARTLGAYYLHLAGEMVEVLEHEVQSILVDAGEADAFEMDPDDVVTLGAVVSWSKMAEIVTGKNSPTRRDRVQRLYAEGIRVVADVMRRPKRPDG